MSEGFFCEGDHNSHFGQNKGWKILLCSPPHEPKLCFLRNFLPSLDLNQPDFPRVKMVVCFTTKAQYGPSRSVLFTQISSRVSGKNLSHHLLHFNWRHQGLNLGWDFCMPSIWSTTEPQLHPITPCFCVLIFGKAPPLQM